MTSQIAKPAAAPFRGAVESTGRSSMAEAVLLLVRSSAGAVLACAFQGALAAGRNVNVKHEAR